MSDPFDPYHVWLGIPRGEQPPNHYRLLGITVFEDNADVIEGAADKQMAHLRTFQGGKHSDLSQRLLNEVSAARVCLLNPDKKRVYDAQLRDELERAVRQQPEYAAVAEMVSGEEPYRPMPASRPKALPWGATASIGIGAIVILVAAALYMHSTWPTTETAQEDERPPIDVQGTERVSEARAPEVAAKPKSPPAPTPTVPAKRSKMEKQSHPKAPESEKTPLKPAQPAEVRPAAAPKPRTPAAPSSPAPAATVAPSQAEPRQPEPRQAEEPKKLPVPDEAAQQRARKLVQETFREEFQKATTPVDRQTLARRLIEQGSQSKNDTAGCYALLEAARDAAAEAGDGPTAFEAIDKMAERFQVDPFVMKGEMLSRFAKAARTSAAHRAIAEKTLAVMEEAMGENNLSVASQLGKLALAEAFKGREKELSKQVRGRIRELEQAAKAFAQVEAAANALKQKPDDPELNTTVGRFTCFVKGDWESGLPMLAKGSDGALKDLAIKDLQRPEKAEDQVALADGWYDLADNEGVATKKRVQLRAAHWYWMAAPELTGLEKTKVEKRMKALAPLVASQRVPEKIFNPADGSVLVLIPAGRFLAGVRKFPVELPAYYLGMYEVTNEQYKKFIDAKGGRAPERWRNNTFPSGEADHPVTGITWQEAKEYCHWAGVRLPTELEWEKGARGVDGRLYPWGNQWDETKCRNRENMGRDRTCSVTSYPEGRSPWGLFNMSGNAWEYCEDWYDKSAYQRYQTGDLTLPTSSSESPPRRVARGGCYGDARNLLTCLARTSREPETDPSRYDGFRVAKSVMP